MKMKLRPAHAIAGNTILVTIITMAIVGVFVDLAMQYTNSVARNVQRSIILRQAINIGDSSTEMAFSAWRAICRQNQTTIYQRSDMDDEIPTPTPGNFPGVTNYTLSNYAIYPLDSYWNPKTDANSTPAPISAPAHSDLSYYYLALADVVIPTVTSKDPTSLTDTGNIVAKVRRVFQKQTISLWRFAVFFNSDMEIHPSPAMEITGDVHTNGHLYTGHNILTLSGKTTYTDGWTIGFKPGDNTHPETPTSPNWAPGMKPAADQEQQPYGIHLDDYHQLIEYTASATALDPYRFQSQAGIVVTIDASNTKKVYSGGVDITSSSQGIAVTNAITTNQTITDNREGATTGNGTIRLATLDVGVLKTSVDNNTGSMWNGMWNGMIYLVDTSADPNGVTAKRAIRLKNGASLPNGGMTVVSGNPIYVQGDYNSGKTLLLQPLSNLGDPTKPTVTGYNRQPAAIVGDAVTVLSNSWNDALSGTVPVASNTTVNAAMVSGNVPTGGGYYSGGVENFPRFLEAWAGQTLTYYGSMIQLYKSQQGIGRWGANNVYSPPTRPWYFDTNFLSNPPPGLLASFNYRRSRWFMQ